MRYEEVSMFKKRKTETTDKQETPEKETGAAEIKAPSPRSRTASRLN